MSKENAVTKKEQESANIKSDDIKILKEEVHAELEEIKQIKQILVKREESFSGPLPHPEHFKKYNQIVPGSANRLLKMTEDDLKHIHDIQNSQILIEKIATIGGLIAGWTIAVIALLGSGYLIIRNHDIAGTVLGTGTLTTLVGVFVYGRKSQSNHKE